MLATYKQRKRITLDMAREIVQTRLDFAGVESRPVLIVNLGVVNFDKAARAYVSNGDGILGVKAAAIVGDRLATKIIMSFIFSVEKPPIPARMFGREREALDWLENFL